MEKMERISNAVHEAVKSSFLTRMIDKFSLKKLNSHEEDNNVKKDRYEIRFYLSFVVTEELGLSEFDAEIDAVIEAIEYALFLKLDKEFHFITKIKKVNCAESDVEIIAMCESVV